MTISSATLREGLVAYAWSAWTALGVSGWGGNGFRACIDIDSLALLTGRLGDDDARLRDESIDWCASNLALVSRSRLAHLVADGGAAGAWPSYAATLQKATKQRWPGAGSPFAWTASGKSHLPAHTRGSTVGLRCRALFGATARGEVLRILLIDRSERVHDARELAAEAAYTKRSVSEALEHLATASVVESIAKGNAHDYRLRRRPELDALLGPVPEVVTSQRAVCRIAWSVLRASELARGSSEIARSVEAARLEREFAADLRRIEPRREASSAPPSLDALVESCVRLLADAAGSNDDDRKS
jgi:hypothetical protein